MDVTSRLQDTLFYTYTDPTAAVSTFADRFSDFGVISLSGATSTVASVKCGVIYMEIDLELEEFCPIVNVSPAAAKRLTSSVRKGHSAPAKETSIEDDTKKKCISCIH